MKKPSVSVKVSQAGKVHVATVKIHDGHKSIEKKSSDNPAKQ